jgi:hypothetical protein
VSAGPPVIILGAERSGTSVCAEMVHAWGAYAGEPAELDAPDALNPTAAGNSYPCGICSPPSATSNRVRPGGKSPSRRTWPRRRETPTSPTAPGP